MVAKRTRLTQSSVCVSQFDLHKLLNSPKHPGNVTMHGPQPPACRIFREENIREGERMMCDYGAGRDRTITVDKKQKVNLHWWNRPCTTGERHCMENVAKITCYVSKLSKRKALKMLFLFWPVSIWLREVARKYWIHNSEAAPAEIQLFVNVLSVLTALMRQHIPQWRLLAVCFIILHKVMPWPLQVPFWIMRFRSLTFLAELAVLGRVVVQSQQTWGSVGVWWHRLLGWRSCSFCPSTAKYENEGCKTERKSGSCKLQGLKNLFNNTRQGGS